MGVDSDSLISRLTDRLLVWYDTIVMGYTNYSILHSCCYLRFNRNDNKGRGVSMAT